MNALARYIQRFDADEVAPPAELTPRQPDRAMPAMAAMSEPGPDKVAEAEAEGRRQGRAEAERTFEKLLAAERDAFARRLLEERARWSAEEGERLAEALAGAGRHLEALLSDAAARALAPFLIASARERALADLCATLGTLLADGRHPAISVGGPRDLIMEIAARLGPRAEGLAFEPGTAADVRVVADSTIIETQFAAWASRLADPKD
jgi:TPR repeat protein